jgi:hypothetical protein
MLALKLRSLHLATSSLKEVPEQCPVLQKALEKCPGSAAALLGLLWKKQKSSPTVML